MEISSVVVATSSMVTEHLGTASINQAMPIESMATVSSQLSLQLDVVKAGFEQLALVSDTVASDTAALLNEGRIASTLLQREVVSEHPRFDVIELCHVILKRVVADGEMLVNAFIKAGVTAAGATIGHEEAHKLLTVDLAALLTQLEHWLQFYH
jgi:N-acetylglutamate synthase/N-acetylornithine aminotransferase